MNVRSYSARSIESYVREIRLLFSHYKDIPPKTIIDTKRLGTKPTTNHLLNRFRNHKNKEPTL